MKVEQTEWIRVKRGKDWFTGPAVTWQNEQLFASGSENLQQNTLKALEMVTKKFVDAVKAGSEESKK